MFIKKSDSSQFLDLSTELSDEDDWESERLRVIKHPLNISAFAIEPLSGLLAIGTSRGTIHIYGGPSVFSALSEARKEKQSKIKLLHFSTYANKLIDVDDDNCLRVWDLTHYGQPSLEATANFDQVNSVALSPVHNHMFLALSSGKIQTFDLKCHRKSPYVIESMWALYQQSGGYSDVEESSESQSTTPFDCLIHPRDPNMLLIAYGGGVVLFDLAKRNTLGAYELVLSPGAPGGAGYNSPDLLIPRRLSVTALAIHPAGHFFAVGYTDGSIGFWAIEDEDHPISVRTVDAVDVNIVNGNELEMHLSAESGTPMVGERVTVREPIFKLAWSGFPNSSSPLEGETTLTILGGLKDLDPPRVTIFLLPQFSPPQDQIDPNSKSKPPLHPLVREAMRKSLLPIKEFSYNAPGVVQDFLLVPRSSPHYSMTYDPTAILLLFDAKGDTRGLESYLFPPPAFSESPTPEERTIDASQDSLIEGLAQTLQSMKVIENPKKLALPFNLWNGADGPIGGTLVKVEKEAYQLISGGFDLNGLKFQLRGGIAVADGEKVNELKLAKYQPHRLLITHHSDMTIRVNDVSAQLISIVPPMPIQNDFPDIHPELTVNLSIILADSAVTKRLSVNFITSAQVGSIHLTPESLELAVIFKSGEILVLRIDAPTCDAPRESSDNSIILLDHVRAEGRYSPYFMLAPVRGNVTSSALSDIGFLATAYTDGSLWIVDMRTPRIMFRSDKPDTVKRRHSITKHVGRHSQTIAPIRSLTWAIAPLGTGPSQLVLVLGKVGLLSKDYQPQIRLVVAHDTGTLEIHTIIRPKNASHWEVGNNHVIAEGVANPVGTFVIDAKSGVQLTANRSGVASSLEWNESQDKKRFFVVTAGGKGVRCNADITGERIGKADWKTKTGDVQSVQIIERSGAHVLVALTSSHEALVYSLPYLEFILSSQVPVNSNEPVSLDESGDFISWTREPKSLTIDEWIYGTLFNKRRAYGLPFIDYTYDIPSMPPPPQPTPLGPVSIFSWFKPDQSMTGEQIDLLLAGPDRPVKLESKYHHSPQEKPKPKPVVPRDPSQAKLYDRLYAAANERGQKLGDLEDSFKSLEEGSKSMVSQAKKLATQETAKSWFGFSGFK